MIIKLHFNNVKLFIILYRKTASFKRFLFKKSTSFNNFLLKKLLLYKLFICIYFTVTMQLYIYIIIQLFARFFIIKSILVYLIFCKNQSSKASSIKSKIRCLSFQMMS